MGDCIKTIEFLKGSYGKEMLKQLYSNTNKELEKQIERYSFLITKFQEKFGNEDILLFSSPGRSEIGGNHTDHNCGKVLAAGIDLDSIGVVSKRDDNIIAIYSLDYSEDYEIELTQLEKIENEKGSKALTRGIAAEFKNRGFNIGGFNICITSNIISAAGLSSSASYEMLICCVLDNLYNEAEVDKVTYAQIGQYAENVYWDKKSGLLDQMACAFGGIVTIDFKDVKNPVVKELNYDFSAQNYELLIVNTGGNHADLSQEYSSIPNEMYDVAKSFDKEFCRFVSSDNIVNKLGELRKEVGDRAVLRALHFIEENNRVEEQVDSLLNNDFEKFLRLIKESGDSSWKWLQNCYTTSNYKEQGIPIALALTEIFIKGKNKGACRVHGGGFAGVILTLLPKDLAEEYINYIGNAIGDDMIYRMSIRPKGVVCLNELI